MNIAIIVFRTESLHRLYVYGPLMIAHGMLYSIVCALKSYKKYSPDEIKSEFRKFGDIKDVRIPVDFHTRDPRGFAYVEYVLKINLRGRLISYF